MGLRASDEDRDQTVAYLRTQQSAGRLTLDELEARSAAAYAAVEVADLDALLVDLPKPPRPPMPVPAGAAAKPPRFPGRYAFSSRWRAPVRSSRAMAELLEHVAPPLLTYGYELAERTPERAVFVRSRIPAWVAIPCVFLFPFGLFALMIRTEERIAVELIEEGGDTVLVAHGTAPLAVRRAFAQLDLLA